MIPASAEKAAVLAAGNWKTFDSFIWFDEPEGADRYALVYWTNRDADIATQSNDHVFKAELGTFDDDVILQEHNHWAVGWVGGAAIRVYDKEGHVTDAFMRYHELARFVETYPVLDDEDFSRRKAEATVKNIEYQYEAKIADDAPDDWADQVYRWLSKNKPEALEDGYSHGAEPSPEEIKEALVGLGIETEEED